MKRPPHAHDAHDAHGAPDALAAAAAAASGRRQPRYPGRRSRTPHAHPSSTTTEPSTPHHHDVQAGGPPGLGHAAAPRDSSGAPATVSLGQAANPGQAPDPSERPDPGQAADAGEQAASTHRPIMLDEVLRCLQPSPGDIVIDCTLGGGGHAQAILPRLRPGGRLLGLDIDPFELPRTEARLRATAAVPSSALIVRHGNFADLAQILVDEGLPHADLILVDLGVSSMQVDNPERGFSYKQAGPLDMRMDPSTGEPASQLLARLDEEAIATLLTENADEPQARLIAGLLKRTPVTTTHALERIVRTGLTAAVSTLPKTEVKMSVRRTFQALRIAVNAELTALDALLRSLPACLAPGGRVVVLTFHSGEDRRVKKAFQAGFRSGVYADVATEVIRSAKAETFSNRRAAAAKLRWAVRASA